jgi:hypothetical protein
MSEKGHTMRKMIITLLLASVAATPAMAQRDDRAAARAERQAEREKEREERKAAREEKKVEAPAPRVERAPVAVQPHSAPNVRERTQRIERVNQAPAAVDRRGANPAIEQIRENRQELREQRRETRQETVQQAREGRQDLREQRRDTRQDAQQQAREGQRNMFELRREQRTEQRDERRAERIARQEALRNNARPPVISPTPRPGTQPPPPPTNIRPGGVPTVRWNSNNWRRDKRYDWYNHRNKYWWLFQLGSYFDPFGWGYQPYQPGWRMWPSYYSSNYWINDPWYYRLPYAPYGTRWVRYYDDAILVDTWSGQVVDVIYNFFW